MTKASKLTRRFAKYLTRLHKWVGLVLGLQLLFWVGSGFFFTLYPIDEVRGRHLVDAPTYSLTDSSLIPIELAMTAYDGQLTGAKLISVAGRPAYVLLGSEGSVLLDARSGENWAPLKDIDIRMAARANYAGEGPIKSVMKLTETAREYGGPHPVWQVKFDDKAKTRFYMDPQTGEVRATRTRLWRVFDVMWRFHIMDITGEDNFSSWWLRFTAFFALLFVLSGFGLLWHRFVMRPRPRTQSKPKSKARFGR